ncbi:MAG: hypothetical protein AAF216_13140 [Pseudomonadota bacterium]
MIRRLAGLIMCVLGAWLAFQSLQWAVITTNRGPGMAETVFTTQFLWPFVRSLAAMIGGVLSVLAWSGGLWLSWAAAVLSAIFAIAIFAADGNPSLWAQPAIVAVVFGICALILSLRQRTT